MSAVPIKDQSSTSHPETLEERFRALEKRWDAETAHLSSTTKIVHHPAFQEIIGLGPAVLPLMLRDLEERPRLWVWALPMIIGIDPVPPSDRGSIAKMSHAWLAWAKENGYQW